jgi:hypothetical protein
MEGDPSTVFLPIGFKEEVHSAKKILSVYHKREVQH